jgi:DNA-binding SARP family transcriptional activator
MGKESLIREDAPFFRGEAIAPPLCPRSVLQIGMLGSLTISDDDGPLDLPGAKDRALLAYLAASPGVPVPRAKLAALLWGDVPERQSRDSLKQSVWHLRKALDGNGVAALGTDRQSLNLDPASVTVDAVAFSDLLASNLPEDIEGSMSAAPLSRTGC